MSEDEKRSERDNLNNARKWREPAPAVGPQCLFGVGQRAMMMTMEPESCSRLQLWGPDRVGPGGRSGFRSARGSS